jgi:hypothetical protein
MRAGRQHINPPRRGLFPVRPADQAYRQEFLQEIPAKMPAKNRCQQKRRREINRGALFQSRKNQAVC